LTRSRTLLQVFFLHCRGKDKSVMCNFRKPASLNRMKQKDEIIMSAIAAGVARGLQQVRGSQSITRSFAPETVIRVDHLRRAQPNHRLQASIPLVLAEGRGLTKRERERERGRIKADGRCLTGGASQRGPRFGYCAPDPGPGRGTMGPGNSRAKLPLRITTTRGRVRVTFPLGRG
jgi:hypothetical protein